MSQKTGKKLRRRADDEMKDTCIKVSQAEEIQSTIQKSTENGLEKEDKSIDAEKTHEPELNGTSSETLQSVCDEEKEDVTEQILPEIESKEIECKDTVGEETCKLSINNKENKSAEPTGEEKKETKIEDDEAKISIENQMEPLFLESEEVDPELEFDDISDVDSQKSSPVIRCRTRRSQTRNIPTPKTPKTFDTNNDDKTSECSDKPSILTVPSPEITDTESEMSVFKPVTDVYDYNEKLIGKQSDDDLDSSQNVSTKAVVGSDTTRNVDLSFYPDEEFELSPFLTQSRERSVGETLKLLSSRRSIRTARDYTLQNNKRDYKTLPALPKRNAFEKLGGTKRKNNDSPDYSKRLKSESPRLMSYISGPIATFKNRFTKSEIPSSTPKLTAYKTKHVFDNTNVSKITLNETEDVAEKKWCTVM